MRRAMLAATVAAMVAGAGAAHAQAIAPGGSLTGISVAGQASIYNIFGHPGNPGGDYGPDQPAHLITFGAGAGNVFTFSAEGFVSCCSDSPNIPPDGSGGPMNIVGANGLSGLSGNQHIPLVGVFTTDSDPFGSAAPASLGFDVVNPLSLAPLLHQVFYIGDGRAGYLNPAGSQLEFTAPTQATRLYLGAIDAFGFGGTTGYYNDNQGSFRVNVNLAAVPEPSTWAMMLTGFFGAGTALRASRRRRMIASAA